MTRLVASELFKLRTTRTFYGIVIGALGLVLVIVILAAALAKFSPTDMPRTDLLHVVTLIQPFALILGILAITSEFRHGTITPSLLVVPERTRFALAKLVAAVLAAFALALLAYALAGISIVAVLGLRGNHSHGAGDTTNLVVGGTLATALFAALGVGIGALLRNQVGAIIGSLVYLFVLENLLRLIPPIKDDVPKYGIGGLGGNGVTGALSDTAGDAHHLGQVAGGLLLAAYCAVFLIAGIAVLRRRDVSA
jgi:ABC-2 type transport system permease protein